MAAPLVALLAGWVSLLACANILSTAIPSYDLEIRRVFMFGEGRKGPLKYDVRIKVQLENSANGEKRKIGDTKVVRETREAIFDEVFPFDAL